MALTEGCSLALSLTEDARPALDLAAIVNAYSTLLFRIANSVLRSSPDNVNILR
jgi:RNA polymerase sigma-70 factor, ECF subfamily